MNIIQRQARSSEEQTVRHHAIRLQHGARRLAGNDATGSDPAAPQFLRQLVYGGIGGGKILQRLRVDRPRANDRGPGGNQRLDFLQDRQGNHVVIRQCEQAIIHAVRQIDSSIPDRRALQQCLGGNHIIIVAGLNMHRVRALMLGKIGDMIAVIIEHIGGKMALLQ